MDDLLLDFEFLSSLDDELGVANAKRSLDITVDVVLVVDVEVKNLATRQQFHL